MLVRILRTYELPEILMLTAATLCVVVIIAYWSGGWHDELRSMRYWVGCAGKVRVLERQARLSHLALPELLRMFLVCDLLS
jgi:hypothetical protein